MLIVVVAGALPARANCGAEGCPFAPEGPEAARGRFSFDLGYQRIVQDRQWDGTHEVTAEEVLAEEGGHIELVTRTKTLNLVGRARLTDAINLTATLPYVDRFHSHAHEHLPGVLEASEWRIKGWGDAAMIASWRFLGGDEPGANRFTVLAGIKLPTGERHVEAIEGEEPEPPVRPGSGSTDGQLGLQWSRVVTMHTMRGETAGVPLSASLLGRWNGVGTEGYRMGSELQLAVGGGYPLTRWAHVIAQINATTHGRDVVGATDAEPHHTGSTSLYASPGLRIEVIPGLTAYSYVQARIYQKTNGPQITAPWHLSIGTSYAIGR
ncbi:MAG TPA: hypothetical protein VJY35_05900 [Candidatus Eisenbacteria bacterium]|nr:hypothetical protein [Candidatus Eisenbacteria bacterium]